MPFPFLPGIPPLQNSGQAAATVAAAGAMNLLRALTPSWGIFDSSGEQVLIADSFIGVSYVNASNISNYPQEQGAFATYNKVKTPNEWSITLAKAGSSQDIAQFATELDTREGDLLLYTVVTPEKTWTQANIDRVEYRRDASSGAGMIIATIHFVEIRQASQASNAPGAIDPTATTPEAQAQVNNGQTQTATPSANVSASAAGRL